jgi:N-acetylneuraminic acid mutarotase
MPILQIDVKDKRATYNRRGGEIVCGNRDYQIRFAFDEEWDAYPVKTARFIAGGIPTDVIFEGDTVAVPIIHNAWSVSVGVFAGNLRTTTPALIPCQKSVLCESGEPADPPPDVYAQIMGVLEEVGAATGPNIAYGDTAPTDTSKLWVKGDKARSVLVSKDLVYGADAQIEKSATLSATLPSRTQEPCAAAVGSKIYIFGGLNNSNSISCFDTESGLVTTISATLADSNLIAATCCAVGTKIYVFGGKSSSTFTGSVYEFDAETQSVTKLDAKFEIAPGYGISNACCAAVGSKIYLFGGYTSSVNATTHMKVFDTNEKTFGWSNMNQARSHTCAAAVGKYIYVFSGYNDNYVLYDTVLRFDTEVEGGGGEVLSTKMPFKAVDFSCFVVGAKVYLVGGKVNNMGVNKGVRCYDTESDFWTTCDVSLPYPISEHGFATVDNKHYLLGGMGATTSVKTIARYDPPIGAPTLENGKLQIIPKDGVNIFRLFNTEALTVEIGVEKVFLGNEKDEAETVGASLYKNGTWKTI